MFKKIWVILLIYSSILFSSIVHVPDQVTLIQEGINIAQEGDTVLVARGRYFENINFRGKDIVVASNYIISLDPVDIDSTIIDGSQPVHADTASCVLIVSRETRDAVLEGFTLTGGTGTKWTDEHGFGIYYEGGGILITRSSPTIRNNIIKNNEAIRKDAETTSAGGGGIRCGDGAPLIYGNLIRDNKGMYGAGIVMNFASGEIEHNVILNNIVYNAVENTSTFGGGGIWIYGDGARTYVRNNTIVGNQAIDDPSGVSGRGGGILVYATPATIQNNIICDNVQKKDGQIYVTATEARIEFNNIMDFGNDTLTHNIDVDPLFCDSGNDVFTLAENSPCIGVGMDGDTLGALDVSCGVKMVTKDVKAWINYGEILDTMHFTATLSNPDNHNVRCFAIINDINAAMIDSVELFRVDMGVGNIFGIWQGIAENWDNESTYIVKSRCYDLDDNQIYNSYDSTYVTTTGPVVYQSYALPFAQHPPVPGEDIYFQLTLKNTGTLSDVKDIFVEAVPGDNSYVKTFWSQPMHYGDIAPGDSVTSESTYWIEVSPDCPGNVDIPVYINIASNGVFYWQDSLTIYVDFPTFVDESNNKPNTYKLYKNYPNPFNPTTCIAFDIPNKEFATLEIYNIRGSKVKTLIRGILDKGHYNQIWNGKNDAGISVSGGVYIYKLTLDGFEETAKMMLLK